MADPDNARTLSVQSGEVPFGPQEIFYSRTDQRGVIRIGNSVFRRISGYDWPELHGAPHKIIRHPEMPKAVFRILWQRILAGYPVGAYVKNRAKDGRHYWVYAVVLPFDDGFISVRIKPTTPLLGAVSALYADLREREIAQNLSPEQSTAILIEALLGLGYSGYLDFMSQTLTAELAARSAAQGGDRAARHGELQVMGQSLAAAAREQQALTTTFDALQMVPNNIRIVAAHMEKAGGPITAISENYRSASQDILARLDAFASADGNLCTRMSRAVSEAAFLLGCTEVQSELVRQFRGESAAGFPADVNTELKLLESLEADCAARARDGLASAVRVAESLSEASRDLRRVVLGLDTIKIMGRVECARHGSRSAGLAATIEDLDRYHADIRGHLDTFIQLSDRICESAGRYAA